MADAQGPDWLQNLAALASGGVFVQVLNWLSTRRKRRAEARKIEVQADTALDKIVNERLASLLNHYERRIADLTNEVSGLRKEVIELRKALDARPPGFEPIGI